MFKRHKKLTVFGIAMAATATVATAGTALYKRRQNSD